MIKRPRTAKLPALWVHRLRPLFKTCRSRTDSRPIDADANFVGLEALEQRVLLSADLQVTFGDGLDLPATVVPGDKLKIPMVISNGGDDRIQDHVTSHLYVSTDSTLDGNDTLVATLLDQSIRLDAGQNKSVTVSWVVGSNVKPGDYFLLAEVDAVDAIAESDETNNVAATEQASSVDWRFGSIENRQKSVKLILDDGDGTTGNFSISGEGSGEVRIDDVSGELTLILRDTDAGSNVKISAKGGANDRFDLHSIAAGSQVKSVSGKDVNLRGNALFLEGIANLDLGSAIDNPIIQIRAPQSISDGVTITIDRAEDLQIDSMSPIKSLTLTDLVDTDLLADTIAAPAIGKLTTKGNKKLLSDGDFDANLVLGGSPDIVLTLGTVKIAGSVTGSSWVIKGDTGKIDIKGSVTDWNVNIMGELKSLKLGDVNRAQVTVDGDVDSVAAIQWRTGSLAAHSIKSIKTKGNRKSALDGDFGVDLTLTGPDDPTIEHTLKTAKIKGNVRLATWNIIGNVGTVSIAQEIDFWTLEMTGSLKSMKLSSVVLADVTVDGDIGQIKATQWLEGTIKVDAIKSLKMKGDRNNALEGDFHADLLLAGSSDVDVEQALGSAKIAGSVDGSLWDIDGDTGKIDIKIAVPLWTLNVNGDLKSLKLKEVDVAETIVNGHIGKVEVTHWSAGSLTANSIKSLKAKGDRRNDITGDFNVDLTLMSNPDDPTIKHTLGSAKIAGELDDAVWSITGDVHNVRIDGQVDGWTLTVMSTLESLKLGDVGHADVTVDDGIGRVQAKRWESGSLAAKTIAKLTTTGDKEIEGDFGTQLTLTGDPQVDLALGSAKIAGAWTGIADIQDDVGSLKIEKLRSQIDINGDAKSIQLDDYVSFVDTGATETGRLHLTGTTRITSRNDKFDITAGATLYTSPTVPST